MNGKANKGEILSLLCTLRIVCGVSLPNSNVRNGEKRQEAATYLSLAKRRARAGNWRNLRLKILIFYT
jgi:hypothetical protein